MLPLDGEGGLWASRPAADWKPRRSQVRRMLCSLRHGGPHEPPLQSVLHNLGTHISFLLSHLPKTPSQNWGNNSGGPNLSTCTVFVFTCSSETACSEMGTQSSCLCRFKPTNAPGCGHMMRLAQGNSFGFYCLRHDALCDKQQARTNSSSRLTAHGSHRWVAV